MFVVVRQRRSGFGSPRRLTVNNSDSPSRRLPAADGHSRSSHDAYCSSFRMPSSASSFHPARSVERDCSCCSFGRWPKPDARRPVPYPYDDAAQSATWPMKPREMIYGHGR